MSSAFPETWITSHCLALDEFWDWPPLSAPSSAARSASARCPLPPRFTTVHLIPPRTWSVRRWRRPGSPPPGKLVHPHSNVATICLRAGSYAAISTSNLTHAVGSPRARVRCSHSHNFGLKARPMVAEHLRCRSSVGRPTRPWMCSEEEEKVRTGAPAARGRNSHRSDGSLVDPASRHIFISKIKPCMFQCKPH